MAVDHYKEFIGKKHIGLSIVLALIFWVCFTRMLLPFVPAETPTIQYVFSGFTAACLTGVFFIATQMFFLVLQEHRKAKRERS
ncbi:MAG: hypothetical protein ACO3ZW_06360 [Opitutales bacterium]|jgi:hypothetical protein